MNLENGEISDMICIVAIQSDSGRMRKPKVAAGSQLTQDDVKSSFEAINSSSRAELKLAEAFQLLTPDEENFILPKSRYTPLRSF